MMEEKVCGSSSVLNKAPQDFVVVDGVAFKVSRSSYDKTSSAASSAIAQSGGPAADVGSLEVHDNGHNNGNISNSRGSTPTTATTANMTGSLRANLDEAELIMSRQAARIEELERYLLANSDKLGGVGVLQTTLGIKTQPEPVSIVGTAGKQRLGLAARRRAESSQSTEYNLSVNPRESHSGSGGGGILDAEKDRLTLTLASTRSETTFTPFAEPVTTLSGAEDQDMANPALRRSHSDGGLGQGSPVGAPTQGKGGPPRGLAARLAMGSRERRRVLSLQKKSSSEKLLDGTSGCDIVVGKPRKARSRTTSGASSNDGNSDVEAHDGRPTSREMPAAQYTPVGGSAEPTKVSRGSTHSTSPLFTWSQPEENSGLSAGGGTLRLFIAHDNPQLGNTVSLHLRTGTSGSMNLMMETKYTEAGVEMTCFIIADIEYSGPFEGIENACIDDVRLDDNDKVQRGSYCMVCSNMRGYKADIKSYPTNPRGDIIELDLSMGAGEVSNLDTESKLRAFMKPCKNRVDVILDPSHTGNWYPYWEGRRKMAPQFRSRGIGYLRLGDDMSNYGSAFLSLDAGHTYMDDGATSIVGDGKNTFSSTYPGTLTMPSSSRQALFTNSARTDSRGSPRSGVDDIAVMSGSGGTSSPSTISNHGEDTRRSARELEVRQEEVKEILTHLRDPDLKWAPRSQHLQRLRDLGDSYADLAYMSTSPQTQQTLGARFSKGTTDMISALTDTVLRQNNPHVLRAAVSSLRTVAESAVANPSCGVAWRALLLEAFHLLRAASRQVYEEVKDTLDYLHTSGGRNKQPCLNLTQLTSMFSDIFAGPRGKGTPRSGSDKSALGGTSNTCKVVQWFTNAAKQELTASLSAYATIHTASFTPSCYERIDTGVTLSRCKNLLAHREEVTRDAAVALVSNLVALDMVQQSTDKDNFLSLVRLNVDHLKRFEKASPMEAASCLSSMEEVLLKMTSTTCGQAIQGISRESPRMYEKVLPFLTKQLLFCSTVLSTGASGELTTGNVSRNSSNTSSPSHGSMPAHNIRDRYTSSNAPSSRGSSREGLGSRQGSRGEGSMVSGRPGAAQLLKVKTNVSPGTSSRRTPGSSPRNGEVAATTSSAVRRSPNTLPPRSPVDLSTLKQRISDQWFEAKLMLRSVPTSDSAFRALVATTSAENINNFESSLCEVAERCSIPRGKLLRVILPFDENTSSNDQAAAQKNARSAAVAGLEKAMGASPATSHVLDTLQSQATDLRKTIRVKMADEADLQQAMQATKQLQKFCSDVESYSKEIA